MLQSKNDASNVLKVKLYNVHGIKSINWYSRLLLDTEWEVKPCRGRQRKTWMKVITELLLQLNIIDSQEVSAEDYNVNRYGR